MKEEFAVPEKILIVDDDAKLRRLLCGALLASRYEPLAAQNGAEMRATLASHIINLITLDVILGTEDGLTLAREIVECHDIPMILITGVRTDAVHRVAGLDLGADDYLTKPFELSEFVARVGAVLRRYQPRQAVGSQLDQRPHMCLSFAGWILDCRKHELRSPDGNVQELTAGEFDLIALFLNHPNQVLSRSEIMDKLMGEDWEVFDRAIDVQVSRLRRKIETDADSPQLIKTVRRAGYCFAADVKLVNG